MTAATMPRYSFLVIAVLLLVPRYGFAQQIRGKVVEEETGNPLAAAAVLLTDLHGSVRTVTRSGANGEFQLRIAAGDTIRVRVERYGYESMQSAPWVLAAGGILEMEIRLQPEEEAPVVLDPLTVRANTWRTRNRQDFERRRGGEIWGRFLDEDRLSAVRSPHASHRLTFLIPGLQLSPSGILIARSRGASSSGATTCQPRLFVDGTRFPGDIPINSLVAGSTIRAVEYYPNPLTAPGQFSVGTDAAMVEITDHSGAKRLEWAMLPPCAIIVIWTDYGFGEFDSR